MTEAWLEGSDEARSAQEITRHQEFTKFTKEMRQPTGHESEIGKLNYTLLGMKNLTDL